MCSLLELGHLFFSCPQMSSLLVLEPVNLDQNTLCDPIDCSLPGSPVHGIFQARVLDWVAIPFSRGSSQPRDRTWVSCIVDRCFNLWATREVHRSKYITGFSGSLAYKWQIVVLLRLHICVSRFICVDIHLYACLSISLYLLLVLFPWRTLIYHHYAECFLSYM